MRVIPVLIAIFIANWAYSQEFIERTLLRSYSKNEINVLLSGINASYGADIYKVLYSSVKLDGSIDTLSGLLAEPQSEGLLHPLLIYCHGTVDSREDVPSRLTFESNIPLVFAGLGYTSIAPDYLGLGDSRETIHPYVHAETEVSASYDMIRAIKENESAHQIKTNDQLFITGYSQGGHASMALHRFLENDPSAKYAVTAASHLSGPYDLSGSVVNYTLGDNEYFFVAYLPHTFLSFQAAYGNLVQNDNISQFFKEPYATQIGRFAREEITLFELNDILIAQLKQDFGASVPKFMIRDSVLNEIFNNPLSTVNQALKANDVYDWAPEAPTRIYYCRNDDQVTYINAITANAAMIANGATNLFTANIGDTYNHTQCAIPALSLSLFFFNSYLNVASSNDDIFVQDGIKVFPNPASEILYIKDERNNSGNATIYDLAGRRMVDTPVSNGSISLGELPKGPYILHWKTKDYLYTHKIFIH
jgi:pimeloyl-ACP methyl ester carboxylesterase